jgi:hypothetical protein
MSASGKPAKEYIAMHGKFRMVEVRSGLVAITPAAPFSLANIYTLRCFATVGFFLGHVRSSNPTESIDALAVGVSFAFLKTPLISSVLIIGFITFLISFVRVFVGNRGGHLFENKMELTGGFVLIGIGLKILLEHLIGKVDGLNTMLPTLK